MRLVSHKLLIPDGGVGLALHKLLTPHRYFVTHIAYPADTCLPGAVGLTLHTLLTPACQVLWDSHCIPC